MSEPTLSQEDCERIADVLIERAKRVLAGMLRDMLRESVCPAAPPKKPAGTARAEHFEYLAARDRRLGKRRE